MYVPDLDYSGSIIFNFYLNPLIFCLKNKNSILILLVAPFNFLLLSFNYFASRFEYVKDLFLKSFPEFVNLFYYLFSCHYYLKDKLKLLLKMMIFILCIFYYS